jgi:ABC-type nitrate/sulfonate/bicarbonate transport system permease component
MSIRDIIEQQKKKVRAKAAKKTAMNVAIGLGIGTAVGVAAGVLMAPKYIKLAYHFSEPTKKSF